MGKLNYINRKIDGLKLGQVVNKDLIKRVPPHTSSKAAFRDPVIELDVSGKDLTDDGFFEVASALVEAVSYDCDQGRVARLEELCLRSNRLTIASLQALTPVIRVSYHDLRDLDLSENKITINTDDEVVIWENFLTSFNGCCVLRRIDFSGNTLGDRAFEVMVRTYAREEPMDFTLPPDLQEAEHEEQSPTVDIGALGRKTKKMSLGSDAGDTSVDEGYHKRKVSKQESRSPEKTSLPGLPAGPLPIHTTTWGLRSVPYIVLRNTAMTDLCALHLSYIVAHHHKPGQLLTRVPPAKAGPHAQQFMEYDAHSQCQGIIYLPNDTLKGTGLKVLELADTVRHMPLDEAAEDIPEASQTSFKSSPALRRASNFHSTSPLVSGGRRRQSLISAGDGPHGGEAKFATLLINLDRARSRIQGDALQEAGLLSNDLWRVALKMLCLGRDIQIQVRREPPPTPRAKAPVVKSLNVPVPRPKTLTLKSPMPLALERDSNKPVMLWGTWPALKSSSIPPKPNAPPQTPLPPMTLDERKQTQRVETQNLQKQLTTYAIKIDRRAEILSTKNKIYRTQLPCGFSEDVWRRILCLTAGADGIMSETQQRSMLRWAMDRATLTKESENLGLVLAAQIWRVLEGTGCLTYDMDT